MSSKDNFERLQNLTVEKSIETQQTPVSEPSLVSRAEAYAHQATDPLFMDNIHTEDASSSPPQWVPARRGSEDAFQRWGPL